MIDTHYQLNIVYNIVIILKYQHQKTSYQYNYFIKFLIKMIILNLNHKIW